MGYPQGDNAPGYIHGTYKAIAVEALCPYGLAHLVMLERDARFQKNTRPCFSRKLTNGFYHVPFLIGRVGHPNPGFINAGKTRSRIKCVLNEAWLPGAESYRVDVEIITFVRFTLKCHIFNGCLIIRPT